MLDVSDKNTCKHKEVYSVLPFPLDVSGSICLYGSDCVKLVAEFAVLILSSLTVALVLTFPPEFFPTTCCRLPMLGIGNYYQVFQQKKVTANMFSSLFLISPLSFYKAISMALSRPAPLVFMVTWKYVLSTDRNWYLSACGSCLRVDCKFM